jgi:hypothetical protein
VRAQKVTTKTWRGEGKVQKSPMPIARPSTRAEEYRRLAEDCLSLANLLPAGQRESLVAMAHTWQRLAEEQDRATNLQKTE